jgi:hypothetical protein
MLLPILIVDMNKFLSILTILICAAFPLSALDLPSRHIIDDSSLRISLLDSWLTEIPANALNKRPEYYTLRSGVRIQVRTETAGNEFAVIMARELQSNDFPGWAQGSWVLTRSRADGSPVRIRIFLRSDPYTYVQFRPFTADKCQMDVVLYESYVIRSMPIAVPFERLLVLPVESVLALAGDRFPRRYFDPEPAMYRDVRTFVSAVRSRLPG